MNDLCLKFDNEAAALQVLQASGLLVPAPDAVDDNGNRTPGAGLVPAGSARIDLIGLLSRPVGEPDADGSQPMELVPGWHINVLLTGDVPPELLPYIVTPRHRARVWA